MPTKYTETDICSTIYAVQQLNQSTTTWIDRILCTKPETAIAKMNELMSGYTYLFRIQPVNLIES